MEEVKVRLERHEEQLKTLFKKVSRLDKIQDTLHSLDKNSATTTQLLNHIVEHDKKQDSINGQITETLKNVNDNLRELNEGQKQLNSKVATLEERVEYNEQLHNIDLRVLKQKHMKEVISRYIIPTGAAVTIIIWILENIIMR